MSSVYILEPPTTGKVLLKTSVGDIDVELWAKETPKTCRNFIQLCLEGYYDNTIFHRVVKGFIVQGGDPNGDGTGGESIYGEPFKDEFHQRLRFARRGLLAMANGGKDDNASQFFFTLGATPELQDKHTIFGKITGETIFNMLKLEEGLVRDERPVYPHKIIKTEVLHNPFADIEPRARKVEVKEKKKKEKKPGVKNFKLLSFGAEAEEDEEESLRENEKFAGKGKSTHDILDDPKLSSKTDENAGKGGDNDAGDDEDDDEDDEEEVDPEVQLENIRRKLRREPKRPLPSTTTTNTDDNPPEPLDTNDGEEVEVDPAVQLENIRKKLKRDHKKQLPSTTTSSTAEPMDTYESYLEEQRQEKKKKQYDEIQKEIQNVKKEYHQNKLKKKEEDAVQEQEVSKNETIQEYKNEYDKYKSKQEALPKKGKGNAQFTMDLLEKFKRKLQSMKDGEEPKEENDEEREWMKNRLQFEEKTPVLAKDANKKDDDWFEIYDPRSALNKRRRGETTNKFTPK